MGIFRKTKKKPEKKVRVEEFKFDKGFDFGMPDFDVKPGQIIQMSTPRQSGRSGWQLEQLKRLMEEMPMPSPYDNQPKRPDFGDPRFDSPWQRGRLTRLDDSKLTFGIEVLSNKHGVKIEVSENPYGGDYLIFRTRNRTFKLSRTAMVQFSVEQLLRQIEEGLMLTKPELPGDKVAKKILGEPKTPTDEWAEKWAKENS